MSGNEKTGAPRRSGLELFRILAMLGIIAHHYVVNSGLASAEGPILADPLSLRALWHLFAGAWGKVGVNAFVLISAWFLCEKGITARKFLKILAEFLFYRIVIAAIFWATGYEPFTPAGLLDALLPVRELKDSFFSSYLVWYLAVPFLNLLAHRMTERQHLRLLALLGFAYVFLGTFRPFFGVAMNYFSWYTVLYFLASYIRLHPRKCFTGVKRWGILSAVCVGLCVLAVAAGAVVSARIRKPYFFVGVTDANTLLAAVTALALFLFFNQLEMRPSRFINGLAATAFGVFCIHANSDAMRRWLWGDVLRVVERYPTPAAWWQLPAAVLGIYAACAAVDCLRARFLERPFLKALDRRLPGIAARLRKWEDRLAGPRETAPAEGSTTERNENP